MPAKKKVKSKSKKSPQEKPFSYTKVFIHYIYCLAIIVFLSIASININNYLASQKVLGASVNVSPIQNERLYWQSVITLHPTYVDGYLELAKVDVELGNK